MSPARLCEERRKWAGREGPKKIAGGTRRGQDRDLGSTCLEGSATRPSLKRRGDYHSLPRLSRQMPSSVRPLWHNVLSRMLQRHAHCLEQEAVPWPPSHHLFRKHQSPTQGGGRGGRCRTSCGRAPLPLLLLSRKVGVSASLQCHGELGNDKGASPGSAPHPLRRRIPRAVLFYSHLLQTWSVFQLLCLCVTPGGAGICSHVTMRPTGCKESGSCSDSPSRVPGGDRISLMFLQCPIVYLVFIGDGGGGRSGGSLGSELPLPSVFWGVGSIETCGV